MIRTFGRLIFTAPIVVGLVAASFAPAIAAADMKVGIVDLEKALSASKAGGDAQKQFEAQLKRAQAGIDAKKSEIQKQRDSFDKQKESLNGKALADKQDSIMNMEKELKRTFEDKQDELRRERARLFGELLKKMRKVVDELGESDGYTLILERSNQSVLFSSSAIDITDKVVKRFDSAN